MARVKDLWFSEVGGVRKQTAKHPDNSGSKKAKRWLAIWIGPDGREKSRAFAKKVDAERYGTAQEVDVNRGVFVDPRSARITVGEWCETWLTGYATRRPSTVRSAKVHIAKIMEHLGSVPLSALRPSHVRSWTSRLREDGLADSYVYALHARLSQLMGDAVHDEIIPKSPCSRKTSPRKGSQRPHVATTEQVWGLYDAMPERYRVAVLLGAFVGLRVAEVCGLRVADIDFMRGIVHPAVQYPSEPLKTEMSRTAVPVPQSLAMEFSAHIQAGYSGGTLLTDDAGAQLRPGKLEDAFRANRGKVEGLPDGFRFHDLRHYLASLLIASGADVKVVQARLRHKNASTTLDVYGHLWPDSDESTRAAVDAVLIARTEQRQNQARGVR